MTSSCDVGVVKHTTMSVVGHLPFLASSLGVEVGEGELLGDSNHLGVGRDVDWGLSPSDATRCRHVAPMTGSWKQHYDVIKWKQFRRYWSLLRGIHRSPVVSLTNASDVFFDLRLNIRRSKQSKRRWFETPAHSLWRHRNETTQGPFNKHGYTLISAWISNHIPCKV